MKIFLRWFPAILIMAAIFLFSAQPSNELPNFQSWDAVVKKGGHMIGYGLLAVSYLYARHGQSGKSSVLAWLFAMLYALTDEYHQSFVAGRHSSIWDVLIFDNIGALIALYLTSRSLWISERLK
jgi:VanZ family protein